MGVPAGLSFAKVAPHCAVAGVEILDRAGQAVAGVGHAVGRGRPFVENKPFSVSSLVERFLIGAPGSPQGGDRGFDGGKVGLAADRFKHGDEADASREGSLESYRERRLATTGGGQPRSTRHRCPWPEHSQFVAAGHALGWGGGGKLFLDGGDMGPRGPLGDCQRFADLVIREAIPKQFQHVELAGR